MVTGWARSGRVPEQTRNTTRRVVGGVVFYRPVGILIQEYHPPGCIPRLRAKISAVRGARSRIQPPVPPRELRGRAARVPVRPRTRTRAERAAACREKPAAPPLGAAVVSMSAQYSRCSKAARARFEHEQLGRGRRPRVIERHRVHVVRIPRIEPRDDRAPEHGRDVSGRREHVERLHSRSAFERRPQKQRTS